MIDTTMQIDLGDGVVTTIDRADWRTVKAHKWYVTPGKYKYAYASIEGMPVLMHRLLTNASSGLRVDHLNKRTLDNRRSNLRLCSAAQIQHRRGPNKNTRLGLRGVKAERRENGSIRYRGVVVHNGVKHRKWFRTIEAADMWARLKRLELYGEFAS